MTIILSNTDEMVSLFHSGINYEYRFQDVQNCIVVKPDCRIQFYDDEIRKVFQVSNGELKGQDVNSLFEEDIQLNGEEFEISLSVKNRNIQLRGHIKPFNMEEKHYLIFLYPMEKNAVSIRDNSNADHPDDNILRMGLA